MRYLRWVLDQVQPLAAVLKPVIHVCQTLIKHIEPLVEVVNEGELLVGLREDGHPGLQLGDHLLDGGLDVVRKHQLQDVIGPGGRAEDLLDRGPEHGGSLHPHVVVRGSALQVEDLLDRVKFSVSGVQLLVALLLLALEGLPRVHVVHQRLLPGLRLLLCVIPGLAKLLDVTLEELGAVGILHELLALGDEVHHHLPLVLQLVEHLVLLLNVLLSLLAVSR